MGQRSLTVGHDFSEVPFWATGDRKTVSSVHRLTVVNGMRVLLDMTDSKRKRKYIEKIR